MPDPSVTPEPILQLWGAWAVGRRGTQKRRGPPAFRCVGRRPAGYRSAESDSGRGAPQSLRIVLDTLVALCRKKGTQTFFIENVCH
jgi:hypothetical protein